MHLVLLHGYLLSGTGSNIYVYNIAKAWKQQNHSVTVICQDHDAGKLRFVDEFIGPNDLIPQDQPKPGTIRVITPDINNLLPVYVMDEYKNFCVKTVYTMTKKEIETHINLTADVIRKISHQNIHKILVNHAIFGPSIAKKGLENTDIQYDVKIHGSAIEYALVLYPHLMKYAIEGLSSATNIFAGTPYVKNRVKEVFSSEKNSDIIINKLKVVPPGMDPALFKISRNIENNQINFITKLVHNLSKVQRGRIKNNIHIPTNISAESLHTNLVMLGTSYNQRTPDADLFNRWQHIKKDEPVILYFGKFINAKGVGELLMTIPEVLKRIPKARFFFIGFGNYREHLEALLHSLQRGNIEEVRSVAKAGNFITDIDIDTFFRKISYNESKRILITGYLNHQLLSELLPLASLCIVPSKLAEAFGMVAVEAMASGVLPICNNHSGLKDVMNTVKESYPEIAPYISTNKNNFFNELPDKIETALKFLYPNGFNDHDFKQNVSKKLRKISKEKYSWKGIAEELASL